MIKHEPVLSKEVIDLLKLQSNYNGIDCTLGGGGHAAVLLEKTKPKGRLLGIDWDDDAIKIAKENLKQFEDRVLLVNDTYTNIKKISDDNYFFEINYILCDLGLSSYQLEDRERGFSFKSLEKLDLRFSKDTDLTASEIINNWSQEELINIFKEYGEERLARGISKDIIDLRSEKEITGEDLKSICDKKYKRFFKAKSDTDPATRVWQALRIAVNREFDNIKEFLPQAIDLLEKKGRLAVITFHSLEDRIVKNYFKQEAKDCLCPPEIPVCRCGHIARVKIITKKPIAPSEEEISSNPRARSAKLRIIEKL